MGVLKNKIKEYLSVNSLLDYFETNTKYFYNLYQTPNQKDVIPTNVNSLVQGRFYFLLYLDESNWMQYSPIFFTDFKDIGEVKVGYAINFNFMPFEARLELFDRITKDLNKEDQYVGVTFESMYKQLVKIGYEYALVEYDLSRIKRAYHINISLLGDFLYSTYPKIKYDPNNLYNLWLKKLETKEQRHQEIIQMNAEMLWETNSELSDRFSTMSNHMKRLQRNNEKFGN